MSHISYGTRLVPQLTPRSSMLVLTGAVSGYEPNGKIWPLKVQCSQTSFRPTHRAAGSSNTTSSAHIAGSAPRPEYMSVMSIRMRRSGDGVLCFGDGAELNVP